MPISTDLNIPNYYDDFQDEKDFYRILFKTGVSVQSRELNQFQSILQKQIERIGNNLFATGTITSGCNFQHFNPLPYAKLEDQNVNGVPVTPSKYVNCHVLNETTGLKAYCIKYADGYQSADPDLKTIYFNYLNTGDNSAVRTFAAGDTLKIYNGVQNGIESLVISDGGTGFSNLDTIIAISSFSVSVSSGTLTVGDFLTNGTGANVEIVALDSTTLANVDQIIVRVKPRTVDLANGSANSLAWTISNNDSISDTTSGAVAAVTKIIGIGFSANIVTDSIGTVIDTTIISNGYEYTSIPYITIRSIDNSTGINALVLTPQNYIDNVLVATAPHTQTIGNGYAFGVSGGEIYQKGTMLRVSPQSIIISKYNTTPTDVAAAFTTAETIINSNIDQSLLDPASSSKNSGAPGADRLKLVPSLILVTEDDAKSNSEIFPICSWNNGQPAVQRQQTVYNKIGDTMAQRLYEQSGDFFVNPFNVTTSSPLSNDVGKTFDVVVDPGIAYIDGYRVATQKNFYLNDLKATSSLIQNTHTITLNYQNILQVSDLVGYFPFNQGGTISLYDSSGDYLTSSTLANNGTITANGNAIGTASIRSMTLASGTPGTNSAVYNMYLFNINMNPGRNLSQVKSVYYGSGTKGIGDVVTIVGGSNTTPYAALITSNNDGLVFPTGSAGMMKNANNVIYTYRTVNTTLTANTLGIITYDISSNPDETFPYGPNGALTSTQLLDLYVVPNSSDLVYANGSGSVTCNTTSGQINGTSTTFTTDFKVGDWIYVFGDAGGHDLRSVQRIDSDTVLVLDAAPSVANSTGANVAHVLPKNVPIPFGPRSGLTANIDGTQQILQLDLGTSLAAANSVTVAANITRNNITQTTKTPNRHRFVVLDLSSNPGGATGPWCLGIPDIFRLRGVYITTTAPGASTNTTTNYFKSFYIDPNQTSDLYDLGWLFKQPSSNIKLTTSNYLLVEFDHFSSASAGGFYDIVSYISSNSAAVFEADVQPLENFDSNGSISTTVNTLEIPEFFDNKGKNIDLINHFDFRPYVSNTAASSTTVAGATTNPASTKTIAAVEQRFPLPSTTFQSTVESYLPRIDSIFVDGTGSVFGIFGKNSGSVTKSPSIAPGTMKIADIGIPGYPCIPQIRSANLAQIMNTGIAYPYYAFKRASSQAIKILSNITQNQTKAYGMTDIAKIDHRLSAVERYVGLSLLEGNVANMTIPSSSNSAIDRFKYGFFVDDFTTQNFTNYTNPQYRAMIESGDVVPSKLLFQTYFGSNYAGAPPYESNTVLEQNNASTGTPDEPNTVPICGTGFENAVVYQSNFRLYSQWDRWHGAYLAAKAGDIDEVLYTLADGDHLANVISNSNRIVGADNWQLENPSGGTVVLYFYAYDSPVLIEVYQGNTLIIDTSSASVLTTAEKTFVRSAEFNQSFFNDVWSVYGRDLDSSYGGGYVRFMGKIVWNYTGVGSRTLRIRLVHGTNAWRWRWGITFPVNGDMAGCLPPAPNTPGAVIPDTGSCGNDLDNVFRVIESPDYDVDIGERISVIGDRPHTPHEPSTITYPDVADAHGGTWLLNKVLFNAAVQTIRGMDRTELVPGAGARLFDWDINGRTQTVYFNTETGVLYALDPTTGANTDIVTSGFEADYLAGLSTGFEV